VYACVCECVYVYVYVCVCVCVCVYKRQMCVYDIYDTLQILCTRFIVHMCVYDIYYGVATRET